MTAKNKDIINKVNEAFRQSDFEGFLNYCAEDVQWTMVGEKSVQGKAAIRQWMNEMKKECPEPPKFTVANPLIAEGDFVAARGDMTMKDKDGKEGQYAFFDLYRFRNDKIVELNSYVIKTAPRAEAARQA